MEQINSRLMDAMLTTMDMSAGKPSGTSSASDGSAFRDLMKDQMNTKNPPKSDVKDSAPAASSEPQQTEQNPAPTPSQPQTEPVEEEQMVLAAMAMLQVQPVQEQVVTVEQTAAAPVQAAAEVAVQPIVQETAAPQQNAQQNLMQNAQTDGEAIQTAPQQQTVQTAAQQTAQPQQTQQNVQTARQNTQTAQPVAEDAQQNNTQLNVTEDGSSAAQPVFRDLEAVPVKVGEAPVMEGDGEGSSVEQQLTGKLVEAMRNGESKVEIQLNPASLGTVKVELTRSADGAMHVLLSADTLRTSNLLERHAAQLQNLLGNQNNAPVQVEVQRGQEDQGANDQHGQGDGQNGQQQQQEEHRHGHRHAQDQDFMQQLRLGLVPGDNDLTEMEVNL